MFSSQLVPIPICTNEEGERREEGDGQLELGRFNRVLPSFCASSFLPIISSSPLCLVGTKYGFDLARSPSSSSFKKKNESSERGKGKDNEKKSKLKLTFVLSQRTDQLDQAGLRVRLTHSDDDDESDRV